jgi:hypothetical protein
MWRAQAPLNHSLGAMFGSLDIVKTIPSDDTSASSFIDGSVVLFTSH